MQFVFERLLLYQPTATHIHSLAPLLTQCHFLSFTYSSRSFSTPLITLLIITEYFDTTATQPDIDGFLVGGASLKPEFIDIINAKAAKL